MGPTYLTPFVGRTRELAELRDLLCRVRMVTLSGPGGTGKTRLAAETLARIAAETDGGGRETLWVELAAVQDDRCVAEQIAGVIGLRDPGPIGKAVAAALSGRRMVVVLDNCEHVVRGAADSAAAMLRLIPDLTLLCTTREPLGVPGEIAWPVPPLAGTDAVALFVERAQAASAGFRLTDANRAAVEQICTRLDGLPLALELAAARVRVLTPEQIVERLDDVFRVLGQGSRSADPRHRTLRAAIDWSYDLLSEREQRLFERLGVFYGGFTLEAAEAVCACEWLEAADVLDLLAQLIDKSLVLMHDEGGTARYGMLEPVRQYARERLGETDAEAETAERHARWHLALVTGRADAILLANADAMRAVQEELDNCRAALQWSLAHGHADDIGLPLAAGLAWVWYYRILWTEGRRWLDMALAAASDRPSVERAVCLRCIGAMAVMLGDYEQACRFFREGAAVCDALGDDARRGYMLGGLAQAQVALGDVGAARHSVDEALRLAEGATDGFLRTYVYVNADLAVHVANGDFAAAERSLELGEAAAPEEDDGTPMLAASWHAQLALWQGDHGRAEREAYRTIELATALGHPWFAARALRVLGHLAAAHGDLERAARRFGAADAQLRALGFLHPLYHEREPHERGVAAVRATLGEERYAALAAEGAARPFERMAGDWTAEHPTAAVARQQGSRDDPAAQTPDLVVTTLGPLRIERRGELIPREAWGSARSRELLLFMLLTPGGVTREQTGLAFWPDATDSQVRNNFHVTMHRLRRALGDGDWVVATDGRYALAPGLRIEVDATRFEREVDAALHLPPADRRRGELLEAALSLYQSDLLEQEPAGDWHLEIRDRLRRLYRDAALAVGRAPVLRTLVTRDPLDEEAARALMRALAAEGDRAEALRIYQRLITLLETDLGVEPQPATAELAARIRAGDSVPA